MKTVEPDHSPEEITKATKEVNRTQMRRLITNMFLSYWWVLYTSELGVRNTRKCTKKEHGDG